MVCTSEGILLSTELHMIQMINFLTNQLLVKLWGILFLSILDSGVDKSFAKRS